MTKKNNRSCCFISNDDWEVTKEIYSTSVVEDGVIDIKLSLHDCVGIRRVGPRPGSGRPGRGRSGGCEVPAVFEYGILSECFQAPIIRLSFQYTNSNADGDDNETEEDEYVLDSVKIDVRYEDYPKAELSSNHSYFSDHGDCEKSETSLNSTSTLTCTTKSDDTHSRARTTTTKTTIHSKWLQWLQSNANDILEEAQLSFSICDFIEHQAIAYFNIIHKDDVLGYTAILFDDIEETNDNNVIYVHNNDNDDSSTTGTETAISTQAPVLHSSSSWNNSKLYTTVHQSSKKMTQQQQQQQQQQQEAIITPPPSRQHLSLDEYSVRTIQNHWREWIYFQCPICFDTFKCDDQNSEGFELPCRHFLCKTCVELYIQSICSELQLFRHSPFICPIVSCKKAMKIRSCDYPISKENIDAINRWNFNLKFPKTSVLTICPRKSCRSQNMRKASSDLGETMVFCSSCQTAFCKICLNKYEDRGCKSEHAIHICDERPVLRLCRRYRNASDEIKLKADEKWHWLKEYASARDDDITAKLWINENASACPRCRTGIERIEGCFHMHCTLCGTHFCYECGEELFYPFYGTHHCWEQGGQFDDFG